MNILAINPATFNSGDVAKSANLGNISRLGRPWRYSAYKKIFSSDIEVIVAHHISITNSLQDELGAFV